MTIARLFTWIPIWPSGKLTFDCQKIAKNLTFFSKKMPQIFIFFKKIAIGNFFEKNENFWQFFLKKCQVLGNFFDRQMAIFWRVGQVWIENGSDLLKKAIMKIKLFRINLFIWVLIIVWSMLILPFILFIDPSTWKCISQAQNDYKFEINNKFVSIFL